MADRFFVDETLTPGPLLLTGPEAHHLASVRRFQTGDRVILFNGDGSEYLAEVTAIRKKEVDLVILSSARPDRELPYPLHVAAALPKGDRGDFLLEKLVELGVSDFTPLQTERSVVRTDTDKLDKLRRATIEASKQCGRNRLMKIHPAADWSTWCPQQSGLRYLSHTDTESTVWSPAAAPTLLSIGPEGGFSPGEITLAQASGWKTISLGSRILRVETAAVAMAAIFAHHAISTNGQ